MRRVQAPIRGVRRLGIDHLNRRRRKLERARGDDRLRAFDLRQHRVDIHAAMCRCERRKAPHGFRELALATGSIAAPSLVPRDRDVHQPLEEVALFG